jgi:hypothetical protein
MFRIAVACCFGISTSIIPFRVQLSVSPHGVSKPAYTRDVEIDNSIIHEPEVEISNQFVGGHNFIRSRGGPESVSTISCTSRSTRWFGNVYVINAEWTRAVSSLTEENTRDLMTSLCSRVYIYLQAVLESLHPSNLDAEVTSTPKPTLFSGVSRLSLPKNKEVYRVIFQPNEFSRTSFMDKQTDSEGCKSSRVIGFAVKVCERSIEFRLDNTECPRIEYTSTEISNLHELAWDLPLGMRTQPPCVLKAEDPRSPEISHGVLSEWVGNRELDGTYGLFRDYECRRNNERFAKYTYRAQRSHNAGGPAFTADEATNSDDMARTFCEQAYDYMQNASMLRNALGK